SELPGLSDHLAADVDPVDFAKDFGEGVRHSPNTAPDLDNPHLLRIFALADVAHIVRDLLLHRDLAGGIELLVRPLFGPTGDVVPGVIHRPSVPVPLHDPEVLFYGHSLRQND